LSRYGIPFNTDNAQIRCIAHVINLVVQKILSVFKEVDADPDVKDYYELFLKHLPIHFSVDDDEDLCEWEAEGDEEDEIEVMDMSAVPDEDGEGESEGEDDVQAAFDEDEEAEAEGDMANLSALEKLRTACKKIVCTPQSRSAFRKQAKRNYKDKIVGKSVVARLMVVRDMKAIDSWSFGYAGGKHRALLLGFTEWKLIDQLNSILGVFTHVTKTMSQGSTPTLPWVLPMYEHMRQRLENLMNDGGLVVELREAVAAGHKKLMQYYDIAKESQYTMLATMLHPALRADWFRKLSEDKYTQATALFRHVFDEYAREHVAGAPPPPAAENEIDDDDDFLATVGACPRVPAAEQSSTRSEADRWLAGEGGAGDRRKPLLWWKVWTSPTHHVNLSLRLC
ncbi:hypothetical protein BD626DRAFT_413086, partial [Schizophyllum amplum]